MRLRSPLLNCCIFAIAAYLSARKITGPIVTKRQLARPSAAARVSVRPAQLMQHPQKFQLGVASR